MAPKQQQINPSRFPIVDVPSTCTIQDLAKQLSITIPQNRGFYSLRRTEPKIAASKEIIAIRQSDGVFFQGLDARKKMGMGVKDLKNVKPADYPDWDIYVQSTSFNRKLQGGWKLMYENTDEPLYATGSTIRKSKRQATTATSTSTPTPTPTPTKKAKKSNSPPKHKKTNLATIFPWTTDSKSLYHVGYPTGQSKNAKAQTSPGVVASSREIYRAILENDASLLSTILSDTKNIIDPLRSWSIGCPNVTPLSKAVEKDRRSLVKLLLEYKKSVNRRDRVQPPTASSLHVHTGELSYRTFGHATASVGVSRGGKEGNNALLMDVLNSQDNDEWDPEVVSSAGMVDYLSVLNPDAIHHWGSSGFYNTVAAGNVECAARIAEMLFERDGYGLNTLHVQVLSLDSKKSLTKFTKPQVCKKTYENNAITPVHCAAIHGETTKFLEALLDANPAAANKVTDGLGRTPMHFAAAARTDKAVKCLIKRGFDVDVLDAKGVSPLALAARYGRHHNIKLLLPRSNKKNSTANEFINTVPKGGKSPLMEASLRGHAPTVTLLLQNGADPTMEDKGDKKRAIHYAAERGHVDVVGALLKASPDDVDAPDKKKRTALLYASSNGHLALVTYLLTTHSADPNLADSSGNTILHYAAAYGWDGICQILVCAGANPAPVNDWKLKPHVVAHLKGHDDVAKMLMSKEGVEVDDVDNDGRTLLSLTCDDRNEGTLDQVKFLLDKGADVTIADLEGRTPLHYLCQGKAHSSDADILKLLLDAGANGGAKTKNGMAPLAMALRNKRVEMVKALLECPCDVSGVDEDMGQTVFHKLMVFHFKDLDIFSVLKTMMTFEGAKEAVSVVDKHGYTPALLFVKLLYKDETKTKEVVKYKQEICQVVKELLSLSNDINTTVQAWDKNSQEKETKKAFNSLRWHERNHRNIHKWQDMTPIKQPFLGWSLLHFATALLLPELIETCLSSGVVIDAMNNEGLTPLQRAFQNMERIADLGRRFFLPQTNDDRDHHCHANKKQKLSHEEMNNAEKATATARTQAFATITKLIQSGANVNAVDKSGTTCLCHALLSFIHDEQHDLSMLRLILNNNTPSGNDNIKAETSATSVDSKAITAPVDINHENADGETVIHMLMQNISKLPLEVGQSILNLMLNVTGVHVTKQDKKGNTPLHYAVKACRTESASAFEAVATLVSRSDDNDNIMMNHQNKIGQTPLTYALANATGDDPIELVSEVLSSCQNIDLAIADVDGLTALHYCAIYGCTTCAVYLLRRGADGEATDAWGNTPLALAVRMGHEGLVLMFFNRGAKCDGEIQWGVKKDDGAVVQYVHKREDGDNCDETKTKNDVEEVDEDEETVDEDDDDDDDVMECMSDQELEDCDDMSVPGSNKISIKKEETCRKKAEIKMERNSIFYQVVDKNWKGLAYLMVYENIPMTTAVRETYITGKPEMVVRILQKVSTPRLQQLETNTGRNLFHIIASLPSNVMKHLNYVTARLLKCGLDASIRDTTTRGMTPLHLAAGSGNTAMVSFLLTQQIVRDQINLTTSPDDEQNTALYIAVKNNQLPIVRALLDAGADPNILPPSSDTLLLLSIRCSQRELTSLLLHHDTSRARIDVNARGADGLAALHVAVDMNDAESCALLLDHESTDVTVRDAAGKTCIHHVVDPLPGGWGSYENVSLLESLVEKGADPTMVDHDLQPPLFYAYRHYSSAMCEALLAMKGITEDKALEKEAMASRKEENQLPPLLDLDVDYSMDAIKLRENTEKAAETSEGKITVPQVDTVADLGNSCDVVEDTVSGGYYDVIMNETKVSYGSYGKSMFYKMQLLNHKTKDMVILWTRYGRVGDEGQNQRTPFDDLAKGKKEFEKIYKSKTGNVWSKRHNFERKPNKYLPQNIVDADKARQIKIKSIDDLLKDKTTTCQKTKLPPPVLNLLRAVTDLHKMRAAMSSDSMEIDKNAMPLGQLSRDSLEKGYSILKDKIIPRVQKLQALYNKDQPNPNAIQKLKVELDAFSNDYYDIIPHNWKWGSVQTLDNASAVDHEVNLMENLLDLEVAVRILAGAQLRATDIHPADYVCAALNVGLQVMEKANNPIFDAISKYAQLTSEDQFEVADILIVNHTEKDFNDELLPRMLLWHGSGLANFIGILAQGLRIAPLSAPASGYMFGKGIYCADMVQKSMSYTQSYRFPENNNDTRTKDVHYLFLCDVALGDASEEIESVYMEKPRKGYDSTKGVGWTGPNEDGDVVTLEGTTIPLGNVVKKKRDETYLAKNPVLNYNEYIVYNTNQCRIRYIVQLVRK